MSSPHPYNAPVAPKSIFCSQFTKCRCFLPVFFPPLFIFGFPPVILPLCPSPNFATNLQKQMPCWWVWRPWSGVLKPHAAAVTKGGNYSPVTNSGHVAAGMSMKYGCGDVTPTPQHSLLCTPPSPSSQAHGKYHNCSIIFVILDPRLLMASSPAIDRDETGIGLEPI